MKKAEHTLQKEIVSQLRILRDEFDMAVCRNGEVMVKSDSHSTQRRSGCLLAIPVRSGGERKRWTCAHFKQCDKAHGSGYGNEGLMEKTHRGAAG